LKIGFPIFVVGEIANYWPTLDRTLVLACIGRVGFGLYQMPSMVDSTMDLLPAAIGQVIYPRLTEHYARSHDLKSVFRMTHKPTLFTAAAMLPMVVAGWFLAAPMTRLIVPAYGDAVPAMQWTLLASYVYSFSFVGNVFVVGRKQIHYLVATLAGMAAYYGAVRWLAARHGPSMEIFPQAMILGRTVFILACYVFALIIVNRPKSWS
jgi:O-antigen/teichoic acid export membrane protein